MTADLKTRCLLTVETEDDPLVATQILGLLTVRGRLPDWFSARRRSESTFRITVELNDVSADAAQLLGRKIARFPAVLDVATSWIGRRDQLAA